MKLAEALQERADLNRKISQLKERIYCHVLVQEGEKPAEDPTLLLSELKESVSRLEYLIGKINYSNCTIKVDGATLTELIAKKDTLRVLYAAYRETLSAASHSTDRARGSEIRIVSVVNVAALRKEMDAVAKELRLVDNAIQQANWMFDLIEE